MFGAGDAGVGGQAVKMVEAGSGGPRRKLGSAQVGKAFLEAVVGDAGLGFAGGYGTSGAGVAALEGDVADFEAHDSALALGEESVFPERGQFVGRDYQALGMVSISGEIETVGSGVDALRAAINFERGAETPARFVERHAGEPLAYSF